LAGAGLDVLNTEPPTDSPLIGAKNCFVTPHIAWATKESRSRLLNTAKSNVAAWLNGQATNVVSAPK
jgi:glycerate dehydrogenase